jgi:hypothetical protein
MNQITGSSLPIYLPFFLKVQLIFRKEETKKGEIKISPNFFILPEGFMWFSSCLGS